MCAVSAITDHFGKKWEEYTVPYSPPTIGVPFPAPQPKIHSVLNDRPITKAEFDALKKEVETLKETLKVLQEYDKRTNQPHCEKEENVKFIKRLAEALGVDLSELEF